MSRMQRDPVPAPWKALGETLAGHFTARARGLLTSDFALLDREGGEVGVLLTYGPDGAELRARDVEARVERVAQGRYRMLSRGVEVLTSAGTPTSPGITCLNQPYTARLSLLRNVAEAAPSGGEAVVRVAGGLTNRRYEVYFQAGNDGSLPVALFLLYRIFDLRRRAYRTG